MHVVGERIALCVVESWIDRVLRLREKEKWPNWFAAIVDEDGVLRYTDNLVQTSGSRIAVAEKLADRVFLLEEFLNKGLIHDGNVRRIRRVLLSNAAALHDRIANRLKESRCHPVCTRAIVVVGSWSALSIYIDAVVPIAGLRRIHTHRHRSNARHAGKQIVQAPVERVQLIHSIPSQLRINLYQGALFLNKPEILILKVS